MNKNLLITLMGVLFTTVMFSQNSNYWVTLEAAKTNVIKDKGVERLSFPKKFKLFELNISPLKQQLFSIVDHKSSSNSTVITLPNAEGGIEEFEVNEASNFEPDLQVQFPDIRAFSGKGITDKYATLKLSISPQGIQTMIFRTDKENEFIEAYSEDHTVYAVFKSNREVGKLAWTCSTEEKKMASDMSSKMTAPNFSPLSNAGELRTMRLAQSCNGEYANYFGATSASQVALVLAAFNATLTRCNGVYEKDLAVHLNLVASTTNVIYYSPSTDPYTTMTNWNKQLQNTLSANLTGTGTTLAANNAAYDIGHMFGKSGGGGNAGCIGCVCENDTASLTDLHKGSGITSPSDGIPQGDNFDIDYVVHEMGHQMGANHTFSNSNEGAGVSKEIGSGVTIMGYAGITSYDVAPHSIDSYHEASIEQIQSNLATKTCPVVTSLLGTNATPVVAPVSNYSIPISTPFVLTGSATDANVGDALTYSWEQNDDGGSSTGAASSANITKTVGPNFISWSPTASPSRYFPKLSSVVANSATTSQVGGDAGMLSEALSSVSRTLNFRLTVRDNCPYSSISPIKVGQTAYTDMKVNVTAAAGPFVVNTPNTAVSWVVGTNQTVTWAVAGTTSNGVNSPYVDIFLSTDGGFTYPIQLASKVPNDGSEIITVPNTIGTTNRIMVKGYKHIFFDISNANFAITAPTSSAAIAYNGIAEQQFKESCAGGDVVSYTIPYVTYAGFSDITNFTVTGAPAGSTVTLNPTSASSNTTITLSISNTSSCPAGLSSMILTATSGATSKTVPLYLQLYGAFSTLSLTSPVNLAVGQPSSLNLTWAADASATMYDVQVATDVAFTTIISSGTVTTNSYVLSGLNDSTNYFWRVLPKNNSCSGVYSAESKFTTGQTICNVFSSTNIPVTINTTANFTATSTLNVTSTDIISDANITMDITHTWINDLSATLTSPSGTVVNLFANVCDAGSSINDISATFDDAGTAIVCGNAPGISGTVAPSSPLSAFNGESMNGTWVLTVLDSFSGDGGAINSWSLNLCNTIVSLSNIENNFLNFALYPNPNDGSFNIKFNSNSNNTINVAVFDMRGREIFNKSYQNSGLFEQNLQLKNVESGIYLVNVQDGDKKVIKKIIIE
jgi:subtilisin-like proprotein convertase family protein